MIFKTGLKRAPEPPALRFGDYLKLAQLPPIPATFGHYSLIQPHAWGMYLNDSIADCTIAGPIHAVMLWNAIADKKVRFTNTDAREDYSAVSGYVPGDESTDNGADMVQVAKYWQKTGLRDAQANRHKIVAYMSINPQRLDRLDAACYLFDAVGLGICVGHRDEVAFEQDQAWDWATQATDGYHYVPYVGKDENYRKVVTWGGLQDVGENWLTANLQEVVAMVSSEALVGGKSLEGFDMSALLDDLDAMA